MELHSNLECGTVRLFVPVESSSISADRLIEAVPITEGWTHPLIGATSMRSAPMLRRIISAIRSLSQKKCLFFMRRSCRSAMITRDQTTDLLPHTRDNHEDES
jgi:hypothetical protein